MEETINEPMPETLNISQSFIRTLLDLPSEPSDKDEISLLEAEEFCKELEHATTLKKLSLIPDIEEKFKQAFISLQKNYHYNQDYCFFLKTIKEISTDIEKDYFTHMLLDNSCEEESNVY